MRDKVVAYLRDNVVGVVVLAVVVILVVAGLGVLLAVTKTGEASDAKFELEEERAVIARVEKERDAAEARARAITGRREQILATAKSKAVRLVGRAKSERDDAERDLSTLHSEAETASAELSEVESSLEGAERTEELSSFGNGIWKAEVDYVPGTYRASGGSGCYWAKLSSADTEEIEDNNFTTGGGQQVVTIDSPYFQSEGCGTWERIGE